MEARGSAPSDRADSHTLGSDWAEDSGNWTITSNTARNGTTGNVYRKLRWVGTALDSNNYSVSGTYRSGSASFGIGPAARCAASATVSYYSLIIFGGDAAYLVYINAGAETILDTGSAITANTDYALRIEVDGSTIRGYVNDVLDLEATNSALSSGSPGVCGYGGNNSSTYCATWQAADLVTGINGTASMTQAAQTVASAGTVTIVGASSITQSGQTVAAAGTVAIVGSASMTQAGNTLAATGTVPAVGINGSAAITQAAQTVAAAGVVAIAGSAAITQASNTLALPHALRFYGNAASQIDRVRIPLEDGASTQYPVNVGAGDFTVEAWLRCAYADNASTATDEDARYSNIVYDRDSWGEQRGHVWGVTRSGGSLVACFGQAGSGGAWSTIFSTSDIGDGEWHHVAVTRNQSTGQVRIWVDGASEASGTYDTTDWSFPAGHTVALGQDNEYAVIGTEKHDVGYGYNGQVDELRISDIVRYTATFAPGRRFEPDGDAVGLYHLDDASGTVASDSATVAGAPTNGQLLVGGSPSGPVWVELPTGVAGIAGAAVITQASQSVASAGVVAVRGTVSVTQAGQTISASATVTIVGTAAITQSANTMSSAGNVGNVPIVGSASITQSAQTVGASGTVAIVGSASITHDGNTVASAAVVAIVGVSSITQTANALSSAGIVGNVPILGAAAITQSDNTIISAGTVAITGAAAITQAAQAIASVGTVTIVGTASATQDGNTLTATANVAIVGAAAITQNGNTLAATMALDLIIAVVSGAIRGTGSTGTAYGMSATGATRGTRSTGSI